MDMKPEFFSDPELACQAAGEAFAKRLQTVTGSEASREESMVGDVDGPSGVVPDEEYTCVHHSITAGRYPLHSFLLFPTEMHDEIVDEYSLWPGSVSGFEADEKIESVGHNLSNSAIDQYVAACEFAEFELGAPSVTVCEGGEWPDVAVFRESGPTTMYVSRVRAGDSAEFVHVLVGENSVLPVE